MKNCVWTLNIFARLLIPPDCHPPWTYLLSLSLTCRIKFHLHFLALWTRDFHFAFTTWYWFHRPLLQKKCKKDMATSLLVNHLSLRIRTSKIWTIFCINYISLKLISKIMMKSLIYECQWWSARESLAIYCLLLCNIYNNNNILYTRR